MAFSRRCSSAIEFIPAFRDALHVRGRVLRGITTDGSPGVFDERGFGARGNRRELPLTARTIR
jgi:hypothetical protein